MSDIDDHNGLSGDDLLAAEHALGVLSEPERAAAEQRMGRERTFAALVAGWELRLAPWAAGAAEIAPPPHVWRRIAAGLPRQPVRRPGIWQNLMFWRALAVASTLAAACLAALLYLGSGPQRPLFAAIEGGGHRLFVAAIDAKRQTIAVVPAEYAADPNRVPELWLIPPGGKPLAVGLVPADRTAILPLPAPLSGQASDDAVLAVSLEPPGGAPPSGPTGPVIGTGKLTNL